MTTKQNVVERYARKISTDVDFQSLLVAGLDDDERGKLKLPKNMPTYLV